VIGHGDDFWTFDQLRDSLAIAMGITKKFDAKLVVFMPAYNGDLNGDWRCLASA
jgi:hypothetical protein